MGISSASAASSAVAGYTMIQTQGVVGNQNCLELAVWMTKKGKGQSFNYASSLRNRMFATRLTKRQVNEAADAGLMPLVDGALTDNSAVATSVAAGASEVLAFQNTDYVAEQTAENTTLSVAPLHSTPLHSTPDCLLLDPEAWAPCSAIDEDTDE